MASAATSSRYGTVAIWLHWLMAALVVVAFLVGDQMAEAARAERAGWLGWHAPLGLMVMLGVILRLAWRFGNPPPPLPADLPAWQHRLAQLAHLGLYALMVLLPLSGLIAALATGRPLPLAGFGALPPLMPELHGLHEAAETAHVVMTKLLLALVGLHVAGALWHLLRADGVAWRMIPGGGPAAVPPRQ